MKSNVNPTKLCTYIENNQWNDAVRRCQQYPEEAFTWVYRYEADKGLRWRILPIHAALVLKSDESVIMALLQSYPDGARMKDDNTMLPLHLAFRNEASKNIINKILSIYPESISVLDGRGRKPIALVPNFKNPDKGGRNKKI